MTNHAPLPELCANCLAELVKAPAVEPDLRSMFAYCSHNQTAVTIKIERGQIVQWSLKAPVTPAEADDIHAGIEAANAQRNTLN